MPTYKYKREDGTTFEIRQSINDEALKECPETGQKVKRVISGGGGVVYKGEGFYVNDYKNGGRNGQKSANSQNGDQNPSNGSSEETTQSASAENSSN